MALTAGIVLGGVKGGIEKYTKINIIIVEPNQEPYVKTVSDDFETLEDEIGQNSMILYNLNSTDTVVI